jgi:hypothetical protein
MSNRALLAIVVVFFAGLAVFTLTLVQDEGRPPPTTIVATTTTGPPIDSDDDPETAPAPPEARDPEAIDPDLSKVGTDDPETVATAWACAYWSHPQGETAGQMAQRLSPLSTPELTAALADLRIPTAPTDIVSVIPGAIEPGPEADTYRVGCQTVTTGPDGTPTAPTAGHNTEVRLVPTPDGWRVAGATAGGLTVPTP